MALAKPLPTPHLMYTAEHHGSVLRDKRRGAGP
jgi:hypothetical protein